MILKEVFTFIHQCIKTLTECSRTLKDAFGNFSYQESSARCEWRIITGKDERILLNLSQWPNPIDKDDRIALNVSKDLILPDDCSVNYLEVRDGLQRNSSLLGLFSVL